MDNKQYIYKGKTLFFEKINKTGKHLAKMIKKKRYKLPVSVMKGDRQHYILQILKEQITREYYEENTMPIISVIQ